MDKIILRLLITVTILICVSYCKLPATDNRILQVEVVDQADFPVILANLVNEKRAELGLSILITNTLLMDVAQAHTLDMATRNYFAHGSPEGVHAGERLTNGGYRWKYWGEVVAGGTPSPREALDGLLNSPLHKAVLLDPVYEEIGAGYSFNQDSKYGHYYVVVLGIPKGGN